MENQRNGFTKQASSSKPKGAWFWLLYSLFFLAVSMLFLMIGGRSLMDTFAARSWKTTDGMLMQARVTEDLGSDSSTYGVQARYSYLVNGVRYSSSQVVPGGSFQTSNYGETNATLQHLQQEHPLLVYYDPSHPSDAALIRTQQSGGFGFFFVGLGIFMTFLGGLALGWVFPANKENVTDLGRRIGISFIVTGFIAGLLPVAVSIQAGLWQWVIVILGVMQAVRLHRIRQQNAKGAVI